MQVRFGGVLARSHSTLGVEHGGGMYATPYLSFGIE